MWIVFSDFSFAALIKPENNGCPSRGVEVNSGETDKLQTKGDLVLQ